MSNIKCELFCHSNSQHIELLYTGFRLLEQQRKIDLSYNISKNQLPDFPHFSPEQLLVKVNNAKLLIFDELDFGDIHEDSLHQIDFLFKKSFSARIIGPELAYKKVFPLGLGYVIYEKYPSWFSLRRAFLEESAGAIARSFIQTLLGPCNSLHPRLYRLHIDNCGIKPDPSLPAGVIFMARLWDPAKSVPKYRAEKEEVNLKRVDCIRKLHKEFGSRFMGGLKYDEYALRYFPDCLRPDIRLSAYGDLMRLTRQYPIGVATTALHDSIGWKFGEYVAFSRAIVSEKLNFEVPGLEAGKHYLEFTTTDECIEAVSTLMNDRELRVQMMNRNYEYYHTHLRPDLLVWNALSIALGFGGNT